MASLADYYGLSTLTPDPTGAAGLAINNNFKELALRTGPVLAHPSDDPKVDDDDIGGEGNGIFYKWSLWHNESTDEVFICADPATGSAVWIAMGAGGLAAHLVDFGNPHAVTAVQAGADPTGSAATVQSNLDTHAARTDNPHSFNLVQDPSPELGGTLDLNGNDITAVSATITPTEVSYLSGVSSNIQTQISAAGGMPFEDGGTQQNFIIVQKGTSATANGTALKDAYIAAIALSPSVTNRIVIYVPAGDFDFGSTTFTMSTDYIDVIGTGVCRCQRRGITWSVGNSYGAYAGPVSSISTGSHYYKFPATRFICDMADVVTISASTGAVVLSNVHIVQETTSYAGINISVDFTNGCIHDVGITMAATSDHAIKRNSTGSIYGHFEQIHTEARLMSQNITDHYQTMITCTGGDYSFGQGNDSNGTCYFRGTFKDCVGRDYCFGYYSTYGCQNEVGSLFEDCVAQSYSFMSGMSCYLNGGTMKRCYAADASFGYSGYSAGSTYGSVLEDCWGTGSSFATANSSAQAGIWTRCHNLSMSSGITNWSGKMVGCEFYYSASYPVSTNTSYVPKFYHCRLASGDTYSAVYGAFGNLESAFNITDKTYFSYGGITENIATGYNITDANFDLP
jgi:hypothetical protein